MEQSSSWAANSFSATQEISHTLWNAKVHYRIHNSPPPLPILSHIHPVHAPHPTFWRSILILFIHLCLGFPSGLLSPVVRTKTLYAPLFSPPPPPTINSQIFYLFHRSLFPVSFSELKRSTFFQHNPVVYKTDRYVLKKPCKCFNM